MAFFIVAGFKPVAAFAFSAVAAAASLAAFKSFYVVDYGKSHKSHSENSRRNADKNFHKRTSEVSFRIFSGRRGEENNRKVPVCVRRIPYFILSKIVIAVQSTQTDEQTLAQIQRMIDASMERLKDSMKLQVLQEQHGGQTAPTVPNQQDLDDMLDNLTIFDQ